MFVLVLFIELKINAWLAIIKLTALAYQKKKKLTAVESLQKNWLKYISKSDNRVYQPRDSCLLKKKRDGCKHRVVESKSKL